MAEKFLISLLQDQRQRIVDRWVERLYNHSESLYKESTIPELDEICEDGLAASFALLQGKKDPLLKAFVAELMAKRNDWGLEFPDLLRFFWEFRKAVVDIADQGADPGPPDWKELHSQLDPCIEAGTIHILKSILG
jgi:hypothetical protein